MDKEKLIAMGLNEEQVADVLKLHKEAIDSNYVPIHRFNEVNTELKTTRAALADRDKQIEGLKKFEGTATELQAKVKELEDANKAADAKYKQELAAERQRNAVKLSLLEHLPLMETKVDNPQIPQLVLVKALPKSNLV